MLHTPRSYGAGRATPAGISGRPHFVAFEDLTRPAERTFGIYVIKVAGTGKSQVIRASQLTATRIARSRTQYGEAELSFLGAIDTPALD